MYLFLLFIYYTIVYYIICIYYKELAHATMEAEKSQDL